MDRLNIGPWGTNPCNPDPNYCQWLKIVLLTQFLVNIHPFCCDAIHFQLLLNKEVHHKTGSVNSRKIEFDTKTINLLQ